MTSPPSPPFSVLNNFYFLSFSYVKLLYHSSCSFHWFVKKNASYCFLENPLSNLNVVGRINLWATAGQVENALYFWFKGITVVLWGLCWCTTLPSIWPMRMWSAGWRSWGTMQTVTLLSCWLATKVTCAISGLCPLMRHAHSQVRVKNWCIAALLPVTNCLFRILV